VKRCYVSYPVVRRSYLECLATALQYPATLSLHVYLSICRNSATSHSLGRRGMCGTLRLSVFGYSWNEVGDSYDQR